MLLAMRRASSSVSTFAMCSSSRESIYASDRPLAPQTSGHRVLSRLSKVRGIFVRSCGEVTASRAPTEADWLDNPPGTRAACRLLPAMPKAISGEHCFQPRQLNLRVSVSGGPPRSAPGMGARCRGELCDFSAHSLPLAFHAPPALMQSASVVAFDMSARAPPVKAIAIPIANTVRSAFITFSGS